MSSCVRVWRSTDWATPASNLSLMEWGEFSNRNLLFVPRVRGWMLPILCVCVHCLFLASIYFIPSLMNPCARERQRWWIDDCQVLKMEIHFNTCWNTVQYVYSTLYYYYYYTEEQQQQQDYYQVYGNNSIPFPCFPCSFFAKSIDQNTKSNDPKIMAEYELPTRTAKNESIGTDKKAATPSMEISDKLHNAISVDAMLDGPVPFACCWNNCVFTISNTHSPTLDKTMPPTNANRYGAVPRLPLVFMLKNKK